MSFWKKLFKGQADPPPPPSIEARMEAAMAASGNQPQFSPAGRLLMAVRQHRTGDPSLALRMAETALPLAQSPLELCAAKYEWALTNLQQHGLAGSAIFAASGMTPPAPLTAAHRTAMRESFDAGKEAFTDYPSYGYPGEHAYEMCARIAAATCQRGDWYLWREWQLVVAAFHTTSGGEMGPLPASPTEHEMQTAAQLKELLVGRRRAVSKEAYQEGLRRGVVPPSDPTRIY